MIYLDELAGGVARHGRVVVEHSQVAEQLGRTSWMDQKLLAAGDLHDLFGGPVKLGFFFKFEGSGFARHFGPVVPLGCW